MSKKLFFKVFTVVCAASVALLAIHGYCQHTKVSRLESQAVELNRNIEQLEGVAQQLTTIQVFFETEEFLDKSFVSDIQDKKDELHTYIEDKTDELNQINQDIDRLKSMTYLGVFEATAYCYGNITSTGTSPRVNHTVAVDPTVVPYGTTLYIDGYGYYVAEDCGGSIKGNDVDIYMGTYNECIQFGRQNVDVYIVTNV